MYVLMVNLMPAVMGANFISGVLVPTFEISAASRGLRWRKSAIIGSGGGRCRGDPRGLRQAAGAVTIDCADAAKTRCAFATSTFPIVRQS